MSHKTDFEKKINSITVRSFGGGYPRSCYIEKQYNADSRAHIELRGMDQVRDLAYALNELIRITEGEK